LMLAAAEVAAGEANAVIVCTWSKLSDADRNRIVHLAIEPVFHRSLGFHPDAVVGLRESAESGVVTLVEQVDVAPADVAAAMVLTREPRPSSKGRVVGFGASNGSYLVPKHALLQPLAQSAERALKASGTVRGDLTGVWVGGFPRISSERIAETLGVTSEQVHRVTDVPTDLGYAAGLVHVHAALDSGVSGRALVVAGGGIGLENTFGAVVEVA
jgi:hypothetical protein